VIDKINNTTLNVNSFHTKHLNNTALTYANYHLTSKMGKKITDHPSRGVIAPYSSVPAKRKGA
jgi:hypothetical protein